MRLFKKKVRRGEVDRVVDSYSVIVRGLFDKESNLEGFVGKEVRVGQRIGRVEGGFGKSGKVKVMFKEVGPAAEGTEVLLEYTKWYH